MIVEPVGHNLMLRLPHLPVKGPAPLIDTPDPSLLVHKSRSCWPRTAAHLLSCRAGHPRGHSAVSTLQLAGRASQPPFAASRPASER